MIRTICPNCSSKTFTEIMADMYMCDGCGETYSEKALREAVCIGSTVEFRRRGTNLVETGKVVKVHRTKRKTKYLISFKQYNRYTRVQWRTDKQIYGVKNDF